ncbi:ABC transporter permease [uncultured Shimia sp.]|uniref:ABC transporter permease n=1 Tax=uncultured Shimia sp. TaxID=573152 RepID=UPI00260DC8B6|nr:ABC transporter permease [uncultured Shimia sp.]
MSSSNDASFPPAQRPRQTRSARFGTFRSVAALILREMGSRYGRSPGGYVWAFLEPLGGIIIMTIGFSLIIRSPPIGTSFLLFYASGMLPFSLYMSLSNSVMQSFRFSRTLLKYPAVTWVDAVLARFLLNALTGLIVMICLLAGVLVVSDTRAVLDYVAILHAVWMTCLIGLAVGVLNCALSGMLPVWQQVWSILSRPLFLMSGIFFLIDAFPDKVQKFLWLNPVAHAISSMRAGFYPTYRGENVDLVYVAVFGLITLFFGIVLLVRYHREILNG